MFLIKLTYQAELAEVDKLIDDHYTHLNRYYAEGTFLASGPQAGRVGGMILAQGDRESVRNAAEADPFVTSGVATFEIIEFRFTKTSAALKPLEEPHDRG